MFLEEKSFFGFLFDGFTMVVGNGFETSPQICGPVGKCSFSDVVRILRKKKLVHKI